MRLACCVEGSVLEEREAEKPMKRQLLRSSPEDLGQEGVGRRRHLRGRFSRKIYKHSAWNPAQSPPDLLAVVIG